MSEDEKRRWTQAELCDEARSRFGDDEKQWAFTCPNCGDIACAHFLDLGAEPARLGQECIGRQLGALKGRPTTDSGRALAKRGCDWAAYGLFRGPWFVVLPGGTEVPSFRLAP